MAIDNKLSNIIGTKIPQWVINQLSVRSTQNSRLDRRDENNILYLANKTAWIRLVSSVNITANDLEYFSKQIPGISKPEDLAKQYVLFGGTSVYQTENGNPSYQIRSGISGIKPNQSTNGAYGILGREEIQNYGYRPMPGINTVNIETQGRLGSVRQAIINFKCWDKQQLDVIDALYFKLGYTMFLEWGHTYYYPSAVNPNAAANEGINKIKSTEFSIIDPFAANLTKESIFRQISINSRESEGNYDAMLGIVTNFNFSYNQEGGYDCTLRIMSLGVLGDSIKINNSSILPGILRDEVLQLNATLELASNILNEESLLSQKIAELAEKAQSIPDVYSYILTELVNNDLTKTPGIRGIYDTTISKPSGFIKPKTETEYREIILNFGLLGSKFTQPEILVNAKDKYDFVYDDKDFSGKTLFLQKFGARIPDLDRRPSNLFFNDITLDKEYFYQILKESTVPIITQNLSYAISSLPSVGIEQNPVENEINSYLNLGFVINPSFETTFSTIKIPYKGKNGKIYFISIKLNFNEFITQLSPPEENIKLYDTVSFTIDGKTYSTAAADETGISNFNILRIAALRFVAKQFFIDNKDIAFNFYADNVELKFLNLKETENIIKDIANSKLFPKIYNSSDPSYVASVIRNINSLTNASNYSYEISVSGEFFVPITINESISGQLYSKTENYPIYFTISFDDTSLIQDINTQNIREAYLLSESFKIEQDALISQQDQIEQALAEQQSLQQKELSTQVTEALSYQSALEIILRTIQVKSLNKAFYRTGKADLEIGRKVYTFEMWKPENKKFVNQIFSNGIYSDIIDVLINNPSSININNYKTDDDQFLVNAKYGFATTLLGSNSKNPFENLRGKEVDYTELLNAYVVPYQIDQEIIAGVKTNHPVYIPFGLLLILLNHICTIYDTKLEDTLSQLDPNAIPGGVAGSITKATIGAAKSINANKNSLPSLKQKPLVYIDYNPKLNFFLTNPQQLSTNPWVVLIPYEGGFENYKKLFDKDIISGNNIQPLESGGQATPLFNPEKEDLLSYYLPKIKDGNSYRGKLMNVLLNLDYLTSLIKDYSFKDGTNNVFLKPFLEHILSDINKYLGNFNALRLSYNDMANTYQFVDDQYIPSLENEPQIPAIPSNQDEQNRTEIPLVGRDSIAKSFELKTEIGSRLANMLAISANSNPTEQVQTSLNGDSFGFLNKNYIDRYIPRRISAGNKKTAQKDGEKTSSIQFNQTISDFYSKINPAYSDVSQATNFFINKMSIKKNEAPATRSSSLIPVSINLSLDGVGGLSMGQAFTVSKNLLPYNYYSKNPGNIFDNYVNQVGFVIVGLSHVIDNNTWTTNVRSQIMPVKDFTEFKSAPISLKENQGQFDINQYNIGSVEQANIFRNQLIELGYKERGKEISIAGDISPKLRSEAIALFKEIKTKYPNLIIEVTAGNDLFHKSRPNSLHQSGNALDFIITNGNEQDINNVNNLIVDFQKRYGILYKDEYDENKQSEGATGNHFHIAVI